VVRGDEVGWTGPRCGPVRGPKRSASPRRAPALPRPRLHRLPCL